MRSAQDGLGLSTSVVVLIVMLWVLCGWCQVKSALPAGSVHVGCSTVSPQAARAVAAAHQAHHSQYVSAPVFARPDGMASAQATIPISGPEEATARIKPLLETTSTGVFEFGHDVGAVS